MGTRGKCCFILPKHRTRGALLLLRHSKWAHSQCSVGNKGVSAENSSVVPEDKWKSNFLRKRTGSCTVVQRRVTVLFFWCRRDDAPAELVSISCLSSSSGQTVASSSLSQTMVLWNDESNTLGAYNWVLDLSHPAVVWGHSPTLGASGSSEVVKAERAELTLDFCDGDSWGTWRGRKPSCIISTLYLSHLKIKLKITFIRSFNIQRSKIKMGHPSILPDIPTNIYLNKQICLHGQKDKPYRNV